MPIRLLPRALFVAVLLGLGAPSSPGCCDAAEAPLEPEPLAAPPEEQAELPAGQLEAEARRLQTSYVGTLLPVGAGLRIQLAGGRVQTYNDGDTWSVTIAEVIQQFSVTLPAGSEFNVGNARLRLVAGSTIRSDAQAGACGAGGYADVGQAAMDLSLNAPLGAATSPAIGVAVLTTTLGNTVSFRQRGQYRICYSHDGTFRAGHADVVRVNIDVAQYVTDRLPAGTTTTFTFASGVPAQVAQDGGSVLISAGDSLTGMRFLLPIGVTFSIPVGARLKVVKGATTVADAQAGACLPGNASFALPSEVVAEPLSAALGAATEYATGSDTLVGSFPPVRFQAGGSFRVCYSDDGTFTPGHVDIAGVQINVQGAKVMAFFLGGDRRNVRVAAGYSE